MALIAPRHAIQSGAREPLKWVLKISDASLRAKCLAAIAFSQTRTPIEEAEMILSDSAGVSARIRNPNYGSSYNFDDDLD